MHELRCLGCGFWSVSGFDRTETVGGSMGLRRHGDDDSDRQLLVVRVVHIAKGTLTRLGDIERISPRVSRFANSPDRGGDAARLSANRKCRPRAVIRCGQAVARICIEFAAIAASALHSQASADGVNGTPGAKASDSERARKCISWFWRRKRVERERPRCPAIWQWRHTMPAWAGL